MSLSRRTFMNITTAAGAGIIVNPLDAFARKIPVHGTNPAFQIMIMATNWGFAGSWDTFASKISEEGYDGAEVWYAEDKEQRESMLEAFSRHNLKFGFLIGSSEKDPRAHLARFSGMLEGAVGLNPVYINCHSGRDYFSFDENRAFIDLTTKVSESSGLPVYHETHRSRILYSSPASRSYLDNDPSLKITLDISHWCNVSESLLADQEETVSLAIERTGHIHARIGHPEGPQVNDPRAPEWKRAVEAHFGWWDRVVERKKRSGELLTILTEFGPPDYMPTLPYTHKPVADQWEINKYMLDTLRKRYAQD